jgi:hypothetical protein
MVSTAMAERPRARAWVTFGAVVALVVACGSSDDRKEADCGGKKVDLFSDRTNCGACGTTCRLDQVCDLGNCRCLNTTCDMKCVDLQTDVTNCGACNKACDVGSRCDKGTCTP